MKVEMLATGNELLDGSIADKHTQYVATHLRSFGLSVARTTIVTDEPEDLAEAFLSAFQRSDIVIVSGGLGPTTDDRSLEIAAKTFGSQLIESEEARENVVQILRRHGREKKLNAGHRKMFLIPEGSEVVTNIAGAAPAVKWTIADKVFFFLPGPPHEFSRVFEDHLLEFFQKRASGPKRHLLVYKVFGWAESELSALCEKLPIPPDVEVGFRTTLPENHIKFFVPASCLNDAKKEMKSVSESLRKHLGLSLFCEDPNQSFAETVVAKLMQQKKRVALAESCTGGLASSLLVSVPGSSTVLDRSFVTYSNESKCEMLGVKESSIESFGAVSEEVAREMAEGALKNSHADLAVAITGVAGPSGGSKEKPVGTVWLAKAHQTKKTKAKLLKLRFQRSLNQSFSAYSALQFLLED